ncbi:MAG: M67 family metallopeptidase [Gemmataceae bacterium]
MRPFFSLAIPDGILRELREHARRESPLECCGILAGDRGCVARMFPIRNDAVSPVEYFTNARDLLNTQRAIREADLTELALYHSHPAGEAIPSRTDLERNTWGESVAHVIIGMDSIRAWWLGPDRFEELPIVGRTESCSPHSS